jgi:hypothetical protein
VLLHIDSPYPKPLGVTRHVPSIRTETGTLGITNAGGLANQTDGFSQLRVESSSLIGNVMVVGEIAKAMLQPRALKET